MAVWGPDSGQSTQVQPRGQGTGVDDVKMGNIQCDVNIRTPENYCKISPKVYPT